jgi:tetratricopeptide (TPR) repeat protein
MCRSLVAVLVLPILTCAAEIQSDYEEYSPEWFYGLSFVDARPAAARRGMERFFQRDWNGAAGLAVGSGVRVSDQALAQAAVEFARGADFSVDGREDSARASFLRCAEKAAQAVVLAQDVPQVLRSTVLKARCLAVAPDRAAAAAVLAQAAKGMNDRSDAAEFWYGAGRLQEDMGRPDSAYFLYLQSWKADPKGEFASQALHSQGLMLAEAGRFQEIFPLCHESERQFASDPRMRAKLRILEGRAFLGVGDTALALYRWKTLTNAFVKGVGDLVPDSVEAAEVYWRLGDLAARHAAQVRFDAPDAEGRKAAHAARRDLMEEAFGYFRQAVSCYAYPWTPVALRDIAGVIERYALDVAGQKIDFRNDTDRVAQEILVQRKLPTLFQSAGNTYRRQIRLARTSGDGIGIGLQSGRGLARSWWCAVQARRTAADLLRTSPRPAGDSTGLAWYGRVVDSAVASELSTGRRTAIEGLADLSQWDQLGWAEADSLKAFLGPKDAREAIAKGQERKPNQGPDASAREASGLTVVQWNWRALEARRQSRNVVLDIRLLRARLSGF